MFGKRISRVLSNSVGCTMYNKRSLLKRRKKLKWVLHLATCHYASLMCMYICTAPFCKTPEKGSFAGRFLGWAWPFWCCCCLNRSSEDLQPMQFTLPFEIWGVWSWGNAKQKEAAVVLCPKDLLVQSTNYTINRIKSHLPWLQMKDVKA